MYSTLYSYFQIRSDASCSRGTDAAALKRFLSGLAEVQPVNDGSYGAAGGAPWLSISLLDADSSGNYSTTPAGCPALVNLISIVGSKKDGDISRLFYVNLMVRIGAFLGWEVIEEEDEGGNQDVVLWRPDSSALAKTDPELIG